MLFFIMKLVALNKPFNVLSQFRADGVHQTLANYIDDKDLRIVGRLDLDSEGLLLLTDDGQLNQHITHPKYKQWKTYIVQVDGQVTAEAVQKLEQGVMLNDGRTLPAQVCIIEQPDWLWQREPPVRFRKNIPTSWLEIKICEGRNRQVRRMTANVGFPTLRLIRTQIGSIHLLDLAIDVGQSVALNIENYVELKDMATMDKKLSSHSSLKSQHKMRAKSNAKTGVLRSRNSFRKY